MSEIHGNEIEEIHSKVGAGTPHARENAAPGSGSDDRARPHQSMAILAPVGLQVLMEVQLNNRICSVCGGDSEFSLFAFGESYVSQREEEERALQLWRDENERLSDEEAEEHYRRCAVRELARERLIALSFANYADDPAATDRLGDQMTAGLEMERLEFYGSGRLPFSGGEFVG